MTTNLNDFLSAVWDSDTPIDLDQTVDLSTTFSTSMLGNVFLSRTLQIPDSEWIVDHEGLNQFMGADGSIDIVALEKTITEIKVNSFWYLYQAQLEEINYHRFDLTMRDFKPTDRIIPGKVAHFPRKFVVYLDRNFIDESRRIAFRRSEFFNKELSIFDIASNPHLFTHTFMVFIDGKFYDNLHLYCDEDKTYLIVTLQDGSAVGLPESYFEELRAQNSKVTVFFIPNCAYGVYNTNINVLNKYKENLALDRFNIINNLDDETKYVTFINNNDLLFESVITDTTNSTDMLRFHNNSLEDFSSKLVHLNIFGFRNLLDQIDIEPDFTLVNKKVDLPGLDSITQANGCSVSPDGKYMVVTHTSGSTLAIYKKNGSDYEKLPDPADLPSGDTSLACAFSPDSQYLVVTCNGSVPILIYKIVNDEFIALPNPDVLPTGESQGAAFSPDGMYLAVTHTSSPYVTIYKRNGDTFTKLANPAVLPTNTGYGCSFSPDGKYLAVTHAEYPRITIYKRVGDIFTKLANPSVLPSDNALGCSFSHNGQYLSIVSVAEPYLITYKRTDDTFTKINDPDVLLPGPAKSVAFSQHDKFVAITHELSPFVTIYERTKDTLTKVNNITPLPIGEATGCVFTPSDKQLLVTYKTAPFATLYDAREPKFFEIPRQDMPVPVENLMFFRNINGNKYFAHDITAKLYYPNFYEIIGNVNNENLTIYVFYADDTKTSGFQRYTNEIEVYQSMLNITTNDYENMLVTSLARNYMPELFEYSIKDFHQSGYAPNHFFYKINKFLDWIEKNPDLLRQYIINRMTKADGDGFYIDCSKLDLNSKYRVNNYREVQYDDQKEVFDGSYYVFILRNEFFDNEMHYRFFIDGLLYAPKYTCKDDRFIYVYLPTSMISPNSIIEVEKFVSFEFAKNIRFSALNEEIPITLNHRIEGAIASDLFIVETASKNYVDKTKYNIQISAYGTTTTLPIGSAKPLPDTFTLIVKDDSLLDLDLTVYVKKYFYFERFDIKTEEDRMEPFLFQSKSNNDPAYIRAFKNGRFIPLDIIHTQFSNKMDGQNIVFPQIMKQIDDIFVLDYTPFRYTHVYRLEQIDPSGFIDLRGKIDKPFDLKWYDVYLNGRKLFARNIDIITPTIIRLKNVVSKKNFVIIQKNRDPEFFHIDVDSKTIMDKIWDNDQEFRDRLEATLPPIESYEPDIVNDIVNAVSYELWLFFKNIVSVKKFINPDLYQITDDEKAPFPLFFGDGNVAFLNPNFTGGSEAETKIKIFPQV